MKSRTERIDTFLQTGILAGICIILYAGPASIFGVSRVFDEEVNSATGGSEILLWVLAIWMIAIPLFLARRWWDTNPARSAVGLMVFLMLMLLIWLVGRGIGVWILWMALSAPFFMWGDDGPLVDIVFYAAVALSAILFIVVPLAALIFQLSRYQTWDRATT